jgi:uncharacterized protein YyaL (SSP411 family)
LYDGALPSGNAVMAANLRRVGILTNDTVMIKRSEAMIEFIREQSVRHPLSNGVWSKLIIEQFHGTNEIVILGKSANSAGFKFLRKFLPNKVFMAADLNNENYPLIRGKYPNESISYYLCKDYSCRKPFYDEKALLDVIK